MEMSTKMPGLHPAMPADAKTQSPTGFPITYDTPVSCKPDQLDAPLGAQPPNVA